MDTSLPPPYAEEWTYEEPRASSVYNYISSENSLFHIGIHQELLPHLKDLTNVSVIAPKGYILPQFPEDPSQFQHIFQPRPGHLSDSPESRNYILHAVSDPNNLVGKFKYFDIYMKLMPDGTQLWAYVRDHMIENGGCNCSP